MFFLPAQFGVFCAWQWRLEHTDHNWNSLMTAPVPVRDLYLAKLLLAAGISVLAQASIGGILGLLILGQGWGYAFLYSLLSLGMRANNPERTLAPAPFLRGIHRAVCGAFHPVYAAAGGDRRITLPFGKSPSAGKPANGLFLIIAR